MKHLITLLFIAILFGSNNSDLKNSSHIFNYTDCDAEIEVSNGRSTKSMLKSEMIFNMKIKNTSSSNQTYTLFAKQLDEDCSNKYNPRPQGESNVKLDVTILSASASGNIIELSPGKSNTFKVKLNVPNGISYNSWACIEVNAKTSSCNSISNPQVLGVFVSNTNED